MATDGTMLFPDEDEKIKMLLSWRDADVAYAEAQQRETFENLNFYSGVQWTSEETSLANLADQSQGKPLITVNQVFKYALMLTGVQINSRQGIRAYPVGRGADPIVADLLSLGMKHVDYATFGPHLHSDMYLNGQIAGVGYLGWRPSYRGIYPDIKQVCYDPRDIFTDCGGRTYDLSEGYRRIWRRSWLPKEQIIATYGPTPKLKKRIEDALTIDKSDHRSTYNDRQFYRNVGEQEWYSVWECEYYDYEHFAYAVHPKRNDLKTDVPIKDIKKLKDDGWIVHLDAKKQGKIAVMVGNTLVDLMDHYLPDGQFSISKYSPYFAMGRDVAMVSQLKSQQRELNSWRTILMELARRAPKGTIFYTPESGLSEEQARDLSVLGGAFQIDNLDTIEVPNMSGYFSAVPAMTQQIQMALKEFQDITGISDVLLGQLKSSTSGLVFSRAVNQAAVGMRLGLDNFQRTLLSHYKKLLSIIQIFYPEDKLLRLADDQYEFLENAAVREQEKEFRNHPDVIAKAQELGRSPQQLMEDQFEPSAPAFAEVTTKTGQLTGAELKLYNKFKESIATIKDISSNVGDFDVRIDFANVNATNMAANFETAMNFLQSYPELRPYVGDLVADQLPIATKGLFAERAREAGKALIAKNDAELEAKIMEVLGKVAPQTQQASPSPL